MNNMSLSKKKRWLQIEDAIVSFGFLSIVLVEQKRKSLSVFVSAVSGVGHARNLFSPCLYRTGQGGKFEIVVGCVDMHRRQFVVTPTI